MNFPRTLTLKIKATIITIGLLEGLQSFSALASPIIPNSASTTTTHGAHTKFDVEMLKTRGIDPKVADYFSQAPLFTAGDRRVSLWINGIFRGSVDAHFDSKGQICFTRAFLEQANLKLPKKYKIDTDKATSKIMETCNDYDFLKAYPQTEIELRPNREEVLLVVSTDALRPNIQTSGNFQEGGIAGIINYDLIGLKSQFSGTVNRYHSANTEIGFNAGDLMVRSRQLYSEQGGTSRFESLYTFAQKTFVSVKSTVQAGQINITNSVFPGAAITGLQIVPESALRVNSQKSGASIDGIAQSQARVELRQAGALIHTTLVPAGPFHLENVELRNSNTDIDVRVIEANGEERDFTIPAASLLQNSYAEPGFSAAVGKVRTFNSSDMQSPMVATSTGGLLLTPHNLLSGGLMLSDNQYQAAGFTLNSNLSRRTTINFRGTASSAGKEGRTGLEASLGVSTRLTKKLGTNISTTRSTEGYRDLLDTTQDQKSGYTNGLSREQYSVSLNWSDPLYGGLAVGYSTSTRFDGHRSEFWNGSWGKSFKQFTLSANIERSSSSGTMNGRNQRNKISGNAAYVTLSIPLGGSRSIRSYANKRNGSTKFGSSFNDSIDGVANYEIGAERNAQDKQNDLTASASLVPRYTSVNMSYSKSGDASETYSGELSGGVVIHENGFTLSPYQVQDTFALAKVGNVSGVKLLTPSGPVWTDTWGRAVISRLNPYQNSRVEIATKTLPRNIEIQNGLKDINAGRGAVNNLNFTVIETRRFLLKTKDGNGTPLPKGAAIFSDENVFLGTVLDHGKIFLNNGQLHKQIIVNLDKGHRCAVSYSFPEKAATDVYFEAGEAQCKTI